MCQLHYHTTVTFSEDQVYNLIRACDETAHASSQMMCGLLQRASRLPASIPVRPGRTGLPQFNSFRPSTPMPSMARTSIASDVCPLSSDPECYTSGAIQTGDSNIKASTDFEDHFVGQSASSPDFDADKSPVASASSQNRVTLASLRKETLDEFTNGGKGQKSTRSIAVGDPPPRNPE